MYEIITTLMNDHMLILRNADSTVWEPSQVFCPMNVAVTVMQSWTGSARNHSSINMYLYKLNTVLSLHTLEAYLHLFLTLALDGGQQAASHLGILFLVERHPAMHWMGGGLDQRTGLNPAGNEKNLLSFLWIEHFLTYPTHSLLLCNFRDTKLKD